jgi:3-deoxy-D-manno-octulosonic-acid transferase
MYFVYSFLLSLGLLILLPRFLFDALRHGKYVGGVRDRLGFVPPLPKRGPAIWVHCVSVGETQAARPLVEALSRQYPECQIVVSTITVTGQTLAREVFRNTAAQVFYFPFDWQFTVARTLRRIDPAVVLLMETELWPSFLRKCSQRKIPVILVNGRISHRSFRRYRIARPFIKKVLENVRIAIMQAARDAERITKLGLPQDRVLVSGSLKFDAGIDAGNPSLTEELRTTFGLGNRPVILAASTHAPEEKVLIDAFGQLVREHTFNGSLIIAPRHPERFGEVASLMLASGFTWTRRTDARPSGQSSDLILLDTIGELSAAFPLATIVFVGGSVSRNGGHNILEPAAVGSCIVTGAYTHNFAVIVRSFVEADAILQLPPIPSNQAADELARVFISLLSDAERREKMKKAARELVEQNRGATNRTLQLIAPILQTATTTQSGRLEVTAKKARSA